MRLDRLERLYADEEWAMDDWTRDDIASVLFKEKRSWPIIRELAAALSSPILPKEHPRDPRPVFVANFDPNPNPVLVYRGSRYASKIIGKSRGKWRAA